MIVQQNQGNQSIRTCLLAAHKQSQALQICSYPECKQSSRWACAGCMKAELHKHTSCNQEFLMDKEELFQHLEQKKHDLLSNNEQQYQNIENITQKLNCLYTEISALIKYLQMIEQNKNNNKELQQLEQTIQQITDDFYQLSDEQVNQVIQIDENPIKIQSYLHLNHFKAIKMRFRIILIQLVYKQIKIILITYRIHKFPNNSRKTQYQQIKYKLQMTLVKLRGRTLDKQYEKIICNNQEAHQENVKPIQIIIKDKGQISDPQMAPLQQQRLQIIIIKILLFRIIKQSK